MRLLEFLMPYNAAGVSERFSDLSDKALSNFEGSFIQGLLDS